VSIAFTSGGAAWWSAAAWMVRLLRGGCDGMAREKGNGQTEAHAMAP